jgi:hypothetical protein
VKQVAWLRAKGQKRQCNVASYVCVFIFKCFGRPSEQAYSQVSPFPAQQSKSMVDSQVHPGVAPHLVGSVIEQQLEEHFLDAKGLKTRLGPG